MLRHSSQPCKRKHKYLEPEMTRLSQMQMNEPRAQALGHGYFPCAILQLEDRLVSGSMTMA